MPDGIHIRSIQPDDDERLVAFHERLSPESRRLRFFSVHPHLQPDEVIRFVNVDGERRAAVVAIEDDEIVGVARFDRMEDTNDAEVAVVVEDTHQQHGIATALLEALAERALAAGMTRLIALTLPENTTVRLLFRHFCADATADYVEGLVRVTMPIAAPADSI